MSIDLNIIDSCEITTLSGTLDVQDVTLQKHEDLTVAQTFNILTDSISDSFGILQACGLISYELLNANDDPAPEIASLIYTEGEPTLNVDINAKEFEEAAPQQIDLVLEAKVIDYYPLVPSLRAQFKLIIEDPCRTAYLIGQPEPQMMTVERGELTKFAQSVAVL